MWSIQLLDDYALYSKNPDARPERIVILDEHPRQQPLYPEMQVFETLFRLAAKVLTRAGLRKQGKFLNDPEKAIIDFFNDILVLFLIRLHWDHITKEWIPKPIK